MCESVRACPGRNCPFFQRGVCRMEEMQIVRPTCRRVLINCLSERPPASVMSYGKVCTEDHIRLLTIGGETRPW